MKNVLKKLLKVKSEMGSVAKSSDNPFFKSKYADLNAHLQLVEPLLEKNGLLLLQPIESDTSGDKVVTRIIDAESGEEVRSEMHLVLLKEDMQQKGAAVTYARRFTLGSLLALQAEDDDGETASGRGKSAPKASFSPGPNVASTQKMVADKPAEAPVAKTSSFRKTVKPSAPAVQPAKPAVQPAKPAVEEASEDESWE